MSQSASSDCKLVRLRIPGGWAVEWNTFFDEAPVDAHGKPNRLHNDSPDLLLIKQIRTYHSGKWTRNKKYVMCIDVGWHYLPYGTLEKDRNHGHYKITAYRNNWKKIIRINYQPTLEGTIALIEEWLDEIDRTGERFKEE